MKIAVLGVGHIGPGGRTALALLNMFAAAGLVSLNNGGIKVGPHLYRLAMVLDAQCCNGKT